MIERDLTYEEIITKIDFGAGLNCLCGSPEGHPDDMIPDKYGDCSCSACGREYHFYIGPVAGSVNEPEKGE